jgi:hypothetical protein
MDSAAIKLVNIRVILGVTDDANDHLALTGHANATAEAFFQKGKGHGSSVVTGRRGFRRLVTRATVCPLTGQTATLGLHMKAATGTTHEID